MAIALLAAGHSSAQDDSTKAAAQALFDDGIRARNEGRDGEACRAFAESYRLDAALGTRFNLAECYEKLGRLASAWAHYVGVADAAARVKQDDRAAFARSRADAIAPRLSRIRIVVTEPHEGLVVTRDAAIVGAAQWAKDLPVDAGEYVIAARAPGRRPWSTRVRVDSEGRTTAVRVPALEVEAVGSVLEPRPDATAASSQGTWRPQHTASVAVAVVGLAGLGLGAAFGMIAVSKKDDAAARCPRQDACFADGAASIHDARRAGDASTIAFSAGTALLVPAAVLWITAPSVKSRRARKRDFERRSKPAITMPAPPTPAD
jgi:hypothetical protein